MRWGVFTLPLFSLQEVYFFQVLLDCNLFEINISCGFLDINLQQQNYQQPTALFMITVDRENFAVKIVS